MLDPLDVCRFSTAQAADACNMSLEALATRLRRGAIAMAGDEAAEARNPGTGRSRLFSARRVLHLALTDDLARLGLPLALASRLALLFTDVGGTADDRATLVGAPNPAARAPGYLIEGAQTVFRVLYPMDGGEPAARVEAMASVQAGPLTGDHIRYRAALVLDLDSLHARVMGTLGLRRAA